LVNYKQQFREAITIGIYTFPLNPNQKFKILYDNIASNTAPDGMLDQTTDSIYQVPTGKTLHVLGIRFLTTSFADTIEVYQGDTENAETSLKIIHRIIAGTADFTYNTLYNFASEKFVTYDPISTRFTWIEMYGYEEDN